MSERHWPRPALATTALALLGATAIAGCGGGSASAGKASATETAGVAATTGHKRPNECANEQCGRPDAFPPEGTDGRRRVIVTRHHLSQS